MGSLLGAAGPARAEPTDANTFLVLFDVPILLGGAVAAVGSAVTLGSGRPSAGWSGAGYGMAALNFAMGILVLSLDGGSAVGRGFGISNLVMASADLGLAIAGTVLLGRKPSRLALVPLTGRDSSGRCYGGIGINLVYF